MHPSSISFKKSYIYIFYSYINIVDKRKPYIKGGNKNDKTKNSRSNLHYAMHNCVYAERN